MFQHLEPNSGLTPRSRIGVYFAQLVSAVVHVHGCGLCHLDIKPENLLIGHNGVLKLADFGLSTLAEDGVVQVGCPSIEPPHRCITLWVYCSIPDHSDVSNQFISTLHESTQLIQTLYWRTQGCRGSRSYAAPENVLSKAPAGAQSECRIGDLAYDGQRADIWSVGVVLFLFLYGFTPWDVAHDSSYEYRMYKALDGFPTAKPWTRMPSVFRKLFHHTLAIRPHKRWTAEELQTAITHDLGWRPPPS